MKGFTLIEFVITLAIIAVMATVSFVGLSGYRGRQSLSLSVDEVVAVVRDTQNRSITQEDGNQWGIRFNNSASDQYTVFKGSSYASGTIDRAYGFRRGVSFSGPPENFSSDVIFSPLTGKPSSSKIISLIGSSGQPLVGDITINASGLITSRVEDGIVGYWHFDEATSTYAYDASGSGNTGTLTNGPMWQSGANCKTSGCLSFDGSNDYIQLGASQSYANAVTVSAWVFHNSTSDWDDIIAGGCGNILFGFSNNNLSFGGQCNNPFSPIVYTTNINSAWHHVAGVYNGLLASLYVDSVRVASSTKSGSFSAFTPRIGGEGATENFNGRIDEVRIYNRALSADEISTIYNATK